VFVRPSTIFGIDAGFRNLGFVVWSEHRRKIIHASVVTSKKTFGVKVADDAYQVCQLMARHLRDEVNYHRPVRRAYVELPTGASRSSRAVRAMAMSFALVSSVLALADVPIIRVDPLDIKRTCNASGPQSKGKVVAAMLQRFPELKALLPKRRGLWEHVADAAACLVVGGVA